jgi:tRNA A22 N-methylase
MTAPPLRLAGLEPAITTPDNAVVRLRLIGRMEAWTIRSENILPKRRKARAMLVLHSDGFPATGFARALR